MIDEKDVRVSVHDGARMAVRIYRPDGPGLFPTLFASSAYRYDNNSLPAYPMFLWRETGPIDWYVEQGYAYVHADARGTGFSDGDYEFFGLREQHDLYDIIEWVASRPWSNGKIGGIGQSYYSMAQWFMGTENPPHLACIAPYDGLNDPYRFMGYPGGIEGAFLAYWFNASVRVLQCVAFGGLLCSVASTMAATGELVIRGIRPGRGASFSSPVARNARNRCLHSCTVGREMRKRAAIC